MTDFEHALTLLGRELRVPETPDLVPAVLGRIEAQAEPSRFGPAPRRLALVVAVVVLAALAATLAIPDARSAILRLLHIGGERIELVDELPPVSPASGLDLELFLGRRTTLEEARVEAGFPLRELEQEPDRVYLGDRGTVWFLYGTPEDVRLLVSQTASLRFGEPFLLKKLAEPATRIEEVFVQGAPGIYLTGAPHAVLLVDDLGRVVEESLRLAKDVLVWEADGVSYRLEGEFTLDKALEIAQSLR